MNTPFLPGRNEKVNFLAPQQDLEKASRLAEEFDTTLSELLRRALRNVIEELERKKAEKEIEAACRNYYDFNRKFSKEWAAFETRTE